jgi:hypothetical protein
MALKKQFYLPTLAVNLGDGGGGQIVAIPRQHTMPSNLRTLA